MNILIILPVSSEAAIHPECRKSVNALPYDVSIRQGIDPARGLNYMLRNNRDKYDKFLCIDSDIRFTIENIEGLINSEYDVISGAYQKNAHTRLNENNDAFVAGQWHEKYVGLNTYWMSNDATGIIKVGWVGSGFLCIKNRVLDRLEYPYFQYPIVNTPDGKEYTTYDLGFCLNCMRNNVDVYVDADCRVEHLQRDKHINEIINIKHLRNSGKKKLLEQYQRLSHGI